MTQTERAINELELAGLFDETSDYEGMIGESVKELLDVLAKQGHSGVSQALTIDILHRLTKGECLTRISYAPDQWLKVEHPDDAHGPIWQHVRDHHLLSNDGGKTHYRIT